MFRRDCFKPNCATTLFNQRDSAHAKASTQHDAQGNSLRSFRGLLAHLATLTRNQLRFTATSTEIPMLTNPTDDQRRAFMLIGTPIPLTAA